MTASKSRAAPPVAETDPALAAKDRRVVVIGEKPLVAETLPEALDDDTTPAEKFFIRNNGKIVPPAGDPSRWMLSIDGEVNSTLTLSLGEIKSKFAQVTQRMVLECGGNGRAFFSPETEGVQCITAARVVRNGPASGFATFCWRPD